MEMNTHVIEQQLERIGDLLERNMSAGVLRKENEKLTHLLSMKEAEIEFLSSPTNKAEPVALSPIEVKLADSFVDAVLRDFSPYVSANSEAGLALRQTLDKWTLRYFAHANDTELKLAQTFEELNALRH